MRISIREEMAVRRGTSIYCVESDCRPVTMLRICLWQASEWVLPWSRFESSRFSNVGEFERAELSFAHHRVTAIGRNFQELRTELLNFQLRCFRDVPESLYPSFAPNEPFINQLEVCVLNEQKNRAVDGIPF